jgi:hypothetical protein
MSERLLHVVYINIRYPSARLPDYLYTTNMTEVDIVILD